MKTELDTLMQQRSLDGLLVSGGTHEHPCMYDLANGAKGGASTLAIKQRGHEPVLIVVGMERDEAAKSRLQVVDRAKYKPSELLAAEGGDALRAHARLVHALCADFGLSGSVGVYGRAEQGHTLALFADLAQRMPAIRFVGETTPTVFDRAQRTKSAAEMARSCSRYQCHRADARLSGQPPGARRRAGYCSRQPAHHWRGQARDPALDL